jgi:hypothetical protein
MVPVVRKRRVVVPKRIIRNREAVKLGIPPISIRFVIFLGGLWEDDCVAME